MRIYDIIQKKKVGNPLTDDEIAFAVNGYTNGSLTSAQMTALLMAIYFRGMTDAELNALTHVMTISGDCVDLRGINGFTVDKHSTGGVGDKTTMIVAPIVAACGGKVAKMSGRGLGHTGGTVDKLESIPGFRTELPTEEFLNCINKVGVCVIGQSGNLTPADKKIYALRDETATVDSIPLIASSVMCKKLAAGAQGIVLDVKCGSGAFMKTTDDAILLAEKMVNIGKAAGRKTTAVITDMDVPLGNAVGNALEVKEAIHVLQNKQHDALYTLCITLAANMLMMVHEQPFEACVAMAEDAVSTGAALHKLRDMVETQGGNASWIDDPSQFPNTAFCREIKAADSGYITAMQAEQIGIAAVLLGAGREKKSQSIDHAAGIYLHKHTGDAVAAGETIATLYTNQQNTLTTAADTMQAGIRIGEQPPQAHDIIIKTIR